MKNCLSALAAVVLLTTACSNDAGSGATASAAEDLESGQGRALEVGRALVGKAAPAVLLKSIDGETIDLAANYGRRPVYLKFWATWCIPCRQQMPGFESDFRKYRDRILTVAVNTGFNDSEEAVREYRQQHGLTMPIAIDDGSLGQALSLRVTPQHVVIGRSGRILYVGHEEDAALHQALEQAIAEPPATAGAAASVAEQRWRVGDVVQGLDPALAKSAGFPIGGPAEDGKPRALLFFSPWCESYLKDSRPEQARACGRVRQEVNRLAAKGGTRLVGISSGLWSSARDLDDYRDSKALGIPLHLDADGSLFRRFDVREVPTLIVIDAKGRVARRVGPNDKDLNVAVGTARAD